MKRIVVVTALVVFAVSAVQLGWAAANLPAVKNVSQTAPGTAGQIKETSSAVSKAGTPSTEQWSVSKIEGNTITLKNSAGQTKTVQGTAPAGLKVGDKVRLQGNKIESWDWGNTAPKTQTGGQGSPAANAGQAKEAPRTVTTPSK